MKLFIPKNTFYPWAIFSPPSLKDIIISANTQKHTNYTSILIGSLKLNWVKWLQIANRCKCEPPESNIHK